MARFTIDGGIVERMAGARNQPQSGADRFKKHVRNLFHRPAEQNRTSCDCLVRDSTSFASPGEMTGDTTGSIIAGPSLSKIDHLSKV
jgi:hypothetical protein